MTEKKSLQELDDLELEDAVLEEVSGGHIVIHDNPGKAYKLYCPDCGSAHIRFHYKYTDMNGHRGGEGNYEWETRKVVQQYIHGNKLDCLDCGKEFRTDQAKWECLPRWDPNDYSD